VSILNIFFIKAAFNNGFYPSSGHSGSLVLSSYLPQLLLFSLLLLVLTSLSLFLWLSKHENRVVSLLRIYCMPIFIYSFGVVSPLFLAILFNDNYQSVLQTYSFSFLLLQVFTPYISNTIPGLKSSGQGFIGLLLSFAKTFMPIIIAIIFIAIAYFSCYRKKLSRDKIIASIIQSKHFLYALFLLIVTYYLTTKLIRVNNAQDTQVGFFLMLTAAVVFYKETYNLLIKYKKVILVIGFVLLLNLSYSKYTLYLSNVVNNGRRESSWLNNIINWKSWTYKHRTIFYNNLMNDRYPSEEMWINSFIHQLTPAKVSICSN
jgi:hypothetical protein